MNFPKLSPRAMGIACVMVSVTIWSGWMVLSSYSVRGSLTAYDITALRFTTAAILLLPLTIKLGLRVGPYGVWGSIWLAAMMGATYNTICIVGFKYAPTSHGSIIQTTVLLLTTLGGVWLLREKLNRLQAVGILLSVIGIACLLLASNEAEPNMWIGHLLFFVGGVMWACYTLSLRHWKADPLQVTAAISFISMVGYLPVYFLFLPSQIGMHNLPEVAFQALYQGVLNSILALLCYNRAVKLLGAGTTSTFLPLIPVIASLLAMPVLGEFPNLLEWSGMTLAAIGVLMATGVATRWLQKKHLA